ncbi:NAD(P)H-dependent oxidoreductase [Reichenbachiella agarivorans]|uniref:NAD(P)H-dependent oxidoreductase n=1 Tax=Reichenbachiella agarivorans TaxID=2979464 RepID=A0ABY6CMV0_9BACT|nr:NAD(P)H-dependent oxidoreductase [Reichenbachiella agarivorans]UXP31826.1 NAD(P)H-dependent oxidoreductase [Reichenbachiella agarivorans]
MKKVLIINGNPITNSFSRTITDVYQSSAEDADAIVKTIHIAELDFDLSLREGYKERQEMEKDLVEATELILWCDHIVWVHPVWWYGYPAIMKGFIDRTFLPHVTFKFEKGAVFQTKLLKGKTGRIIATGDSPYWYYRFVMKRPATNQLKKGTLEFCGIKPVKTTFFGPMNTASDKNRSKWLKEVARITVKDMS